MTDISKIYQEEGVPNIDSLKYWEQVVPVIGEVVDNGPEAKTRAFHVAKTNNIDQVFKFKAAIGSALADGKIFKDFVEDENIAKVAEECEISAWHLSTIYRTNMQSAYAAGRYAQMQRSKKSRPYWRYVAIHDGRTRPEHAALDKVVYPADDPFWDVNYPPNGFNCRCAVVSMTEKEVEKAGLTVSHTELGENEEVAPINQAFGDNPGKNWLAGLEKGGMPEVVPCKKIELADIPEKHIIPYKTKDLITLPKRLENKPEVVQNLWYAKMWLKQFGIDDITGHKTIILPGVNYPVIVSLQNLINKKKNVLKANKNDRGKYLKILADALKNPYEIRLTKNIKKPAIAVYMPFRITDAEDGELQFGYAIFSLDENPARLPKAYKNLPEKVYSGTTIFRPDSNEYIEEKIENSKDLWRKK